MRERITHGGCIETHLGKEYIKAVCQINELFFFFNLKFAYMDFIGEAFFTPLCPNMFNFEYAYPLVVLVPTVLVFRVCEAHIRESC